MDRPPAQWPPQVKSMEEIMNCSDPTSERKIRPQKERALNCPRCKSTNTKFCYYNNYSLSQPRYFCKTCRRYWTEGGSLRNIPVGGGSRKKNRPSSSSSSPSSSISNPSKKLPNLIPSTNPRILDSQDLNLGFALHNHHHHRHDYEDISEMTQLPNFSSSGAADKNNNPSSSSPQPPSSYHVSFLTGLTAGVTELYSSAGPGFGLPEFKPSLNFSLDGLGSNFGSFQSVPETSGKLLFPFEDLKVSNNPTEDTDQNGDHNSTGYWSGVIGGGSW